MDSSNNESSTETIVVYTNTSFVMTPSFNNTEDIFLYKSTTNGLLFFQRTSNETKLPNVGDTILSVDSGGILQKTVNVTTENSIFTEKEISLFATEPGELIDVIQQLQFAGNVTMYPMESPLMTEIIPNDNVTSDIQSYNVTVVQAASSDLLWKVPSIDDSVMYMVTTNTSSLSQMKLGDSFYSDHCTGYFEVIDGYDATKNYNLLYTSLSRFDNLTTVSMTSINWESWMTNENQTIHMIAKDGIPGLTITKENNLNFNVTNGNLMSGRECSPMLGYVYESITDASNYSYFTVFLFNNVAQLNSFITENSNRKKMYSHRIQKSEDADELLSIGVHPDPILLTIPQGSVSYTLALNADYEYIINTPYFGISMEAGEEDSSKLKFWDWESVEFLLSGQSDLELGYSLSVSGGVSAGKSWTLGVLHLKRFFLIEALPVYVEIIVEIIIDLSLDVSGEITYRYTYSNISPMQTGFIWTTPSSVEWIADAQSNNNLDKSIESSCTAEASVKVTPQFTMEFYFNLVGFSTGLNFILQGEGEVGSCNCQEAETEVSVAVGLDSLDLTMSIIGTYSAQDTYEISIYAEENACIDTPPFLVDLCSSSCTRSTTPSISSSNQKSSLPSNPFVTRTPSPSKNMPSDMCGSESCPSQSNICYENPNVPEDPLCCPKSSAVACCGINEYVCSDNVGDGFCVDSTTDTCCFGADIAYTCPNNLACCPFIGDSTCCDEGEKCCGETCCQVGEACCQSTGCCPITQFNTNTCCTTVDESGDVVPICCTPDNYETECCPILLSGGVVVCDISNFFICFADE